MSQTTSIQVPRNSDTHSRLHYILLALIAVWICFPYHRALFATDEGLYYHEALRMMHGDIIYRDFFEFITPGTFFFIKWLFQIFGENVIAVRYVLFIFHILEIWMVFWLGVRVLHRPLLAYLPALFFIQEKSQFWWSIQHHVLCDFTVLLTAYLLIRYAECGNPAFAAGAGIASGLTFCISQHQGVLLLTVGLALTCWWAPRLTGRPRGRPTVFFVFGSAIPLLSLFLYLAANGILEDAYNNCVNWVLTSYRPYEARGAYYDQGNKLIAFWLARLPSLRAVQWIIHLFLVGYGSLIGIAAGFIHLLLHTFRKPTEASVREVLADYGIVWSIGVARIAVELAHPYSYWGLAQTSTLCLIFTVGLMSARPIPFLPRLRYWSEHAPTGSDSSVRSFHLGVQPADISSLSLLPTFRCEFAKEDDSPQGYRFQLDVHVPGSWNLVLKRWPWSSLLTFFFAALLFWEVGYDLAYMTRITDAQRAQRAYIRTPVGRFWSTDSKFISDLNEVCQYVSLHTKASDSIFVFYHTPYVYMLAQRSNATRYSIMWPGYHDDKQVAEIVNELALQKAALVIKDQLVEGSLERGDLRLLRYGAENLKREPILLAVQENYTPVLQLGNFTVYAPASRSHP